MLDGESTHQKITELWEEIRPCSLRMLAREALARCIFDEMQIEGMAVNGAVKRCKDVLRTRTEDGLRIGYNVSKQNGENAEWESPKHMSEQQALFVFEQYVEKLTETHAEAKVFQQWMRRKFGFAPSLPDLQ